MMDEAIKTHKETSFGWVLMLQELRQRMATRRAARRAAVQAQIKALGEETRAKPMRYLGPR
jgi:hypothetical protein